MRDPRTNDPAPLHERGENSADDDATGITGFFKDEYTQYPMNKTDTITLPSYDDVCAAEDEMNDAGLLGIRDIQITIRKGLVKYWCHTSSRDIKPAYSETLAGLPEAARIIIKKNDPTAQLKFEAEKLGFKLVEKGGDK